MCKSLPVVISAIFNIIVYMKCEIQVIDLIMELKKKCLQVEEEILGKFKLSSAEYHAVMLTGKEEKLSCVLLADRIGLSRSRGSRIIERLVTKGYMKKELDQSDGRVVTVSLTDDGITVKGELERFKLECGEKITGHLNSEEMIVLTDNLSKMINLL